MSSLKKTKSIPGLFTNQKYSWFIHKPKVFLVYSQTAAKCFILEPTGTPEMVLEAMCSET